MFKNVIQFGQLRIQRGWKITHNAVCNPSWAVRNSNPTLATTNANFDGKSIL